MTLYDLLQRPAPFAPSPSIWTHPHIAAQMLAAHLDDATDAASYRAERRARICGFLAEALGLMPGKAVLDVGCGPGLYAAELARRGLRVAGIDFSESSIAYAKGRAVAEGLDIAYARQDYREPFPFDGFDAAAMISEDYGVLSPADRRRLLANIHAALNPGGRLALDVASARILDKLDETGVWQAAPSGFYRPHPCVVIEKSWRHPELSAATRSVAVVDHETTVYHIHQTYFTPDSIRRELEEGGFRVDAILGGLDGSPLREDGGLIAILATKR